MTPTMSTTAPVVDSLGGGFTDATVEVNGTALHIVRGGAGPAVVLLHGFPQDWYEWRSVMPRLAERFTVIAVDLRGVGQSDPSPYGYTATELAADIHELVDSLELGPVHIVGHDIGGGVAYAYAREFPEHTRTVSVVEFPIPGIEPVPALDTGQPLWHVPFHMTPRLPEALVTGRQATYFRYFFDEFTATGASINDADLDHYARAYRDPHHLHSAFEFFRAIPTNAAYNAAHTEPIDVPLLLVGGQYMFGPIGPQLADALHANYGWSRVSARTIDRAKHYLPEEQPEHLAATLQDHLERHDGTPTPSPA